MIMRSQKPTDTHPPKPDWHGDIAQLYREKARNRHPDAGGSDSLMAELNVAFAEAKRELHA